jgi:hypothetical protein
MPLHENAWPSISTPANLWFPYVWSFIRPAVNCAEDQQSGPDRHVEGELLGLPSWTLCAELPTASIMSHRVWKLPCSGMDCRMWTGHPQLFNFCQDSTCQSDYPHASFLLFVHTQSLLLRYKVLSEGVNNTDQNYKQIFLGTFSNAFFLCFCSYQSRPSWPLLVSYYYFFVWTSGLFAPFIFHFCLARVFTYLRSAVAEKETRQNYSQYFPSKSQIRQDALPVVAWNT